MNTRHFLQTSSLIIGKHRHRSQGLTGEFARSQAGAGNQELNQESCEYRPTQEEMKALVLEGVSLLFIDCLKGK